MKTKSLEIQHVTYIPEQLSPEILYISKEYNVAGHLCACGCGNKVIVPLGPTEWTFSERAGCPTLRPSIGNWQLPCRSHYFITNGNIVWVGSWSTEEINAGRYAEEKRREAYYSSKTKENSFLARIKKFFGRF